jgi:hypothetical protein
LQAGEKAFLELLSLDPQIVLANRIATLRME